MAAVQLGMGCSGILPNILEGIITLIYEDKTVTTPDDSFNQTMIFFGISSAIILIASLMYFVERRNAFSLYYYGKYAQASANAPKLSTKQKTIEIFKSCGKTKAKWYLLYVIHVYTLTFVVFPGVTNHTTITFLDADGPWF